MQLHKGKTISTRFIWQQGLSLIKHFISTSVMNRPHSSNTVTAFCLALKTSLWWGRGSWVLWGFFRRMLMNLVCKYQAWIFTHSCVHSCEVSCTLCAWKSKPTKQNVAVTWISKYKTLLVKEGKELVLPPALRTAGNQILAQSGSPTPLMYLSRACLKPTDLHLHLWQNRYWEGRKIKTTALPVHLSEPATSALLISGRGSCSVRPERRKKRSVYAVHTQRIFHSPRWHFRVFFEGKSSSLLINSFPSI